MAARTALRKNMKHRVWREGGSSLRLCQRVEEVGTMRGAAGEERRGVEMRALPTGLSWRLSQ